MKEDKVVIKKNEEYIVEIKDVGFQGEGIAKIDNYTIFIKNGLKGEKVRIIITKVLSSYGYGKILEIIEKSSSRVESDCNIYKKCGGCSLRHTTYENTLVIKQNMVQSLVNKTLQNKIQVEKTIGMDNPINYRNKAIFPVGIDANGKKVIGTFQERTHNILETDKCLIQDAESEKIAKEIFELWNGNKQNTIYNEKTGKGNLRHIIIKKGFSTNEYMCILVTKEKNKIDFNIKLLLEMYPNIKTIIQNINIKNNNVILGSTNTNIYGDGYILDSLGENIFKISPNAFYQVNPIQTLKLYSLAVKAANITKEDVVFDLYSGIGTIAIFMAKYAKEVYGIEIIEEAVKMANENAKLNNITNSKFIAGDVEVELDKLLSKNIIPDVVMIDPPRKGLDNNSIENLLKVHPKKLVYISCNPATLVRDLAKMEGKYEIKSIIPVDMFCFSHHIETVCVLERR